MNEAELLFSQVLNSSRLSLYLDKEKKLANDKLCYISGVLKRRISGEPIQYILGKTEFMGLEFKVTPDVFIPRPETEILVETAIKVYSSIPACPAGRQHPGSSIDILDLGTGSGCIAVSLAKFLAGVKITATDILGEALAIAGHNAKLNRVDGKINFIYSDLFTNYQLRITNYDMIIANPPYIATDEIKRLQRELNYEPRIALDGGGDGLRFYHKIINQAPRYLKDGGFLIMEMGFGQKGKIVEILQRDKNFDIIEVVKDYNHIDRIIVAKLA